jgi:RimJ/RimL family protein N-acetyltransferase
MVEPNSPTAATPRIRGTGGMERACRLLLTWGFEQQGVRQVHWTAYRGNFASRKLAWKLGFDILPGHLRQSLVQRGQLIDAWVGSLLHTDESRPSTPWYDAPVLETAHIRLRPVLETDLPEALEALGDGQVARWIGAIPHPFKPEHFVEWQLHGAEEMAQGQAVRWAITDINSDRLIGVINIFDIDRAISSGEVGYWIHPGRTGQSLMSQALRLVIRHGMGDSLGLSRLIAHVAHGNTASSTLLQRHGFTQVGSLSQAVVTVTGRRDAAIFELTDSPNLD